MMTFGDRRKRERHHSFWIGFDMFPGLFQKFASGQRTQGSSTEKSEHRRLQKVRQLQTATMASSTTGTTHQVVIAGGGIVGLVLALALKEHLNIIPTIYEKANGFHDDVGAGMGMYPNGLRVIRDISPTLLAKIRNEGYPYLYRRWERHDGTEVAVAEEDVLCNQEDEIQSIGIRRWKLQKVLYDAVMEAGIPIYFGKQIKRVHQQDDGLVQLEFQDDTSSSSCKCQVLFAADGSKSTIRQQLVTDSKLEYTGVTCIMGMAENNPSDRGICFPSALTTKCHGCFFPTSESQQCFQMHFPVSTNAADPGNWGTLSEKVGKEECYRLSQQMQQDGWDDKYIAPLHQVTHAVRIGFCSLQPHLQKWTFGNIVLVGDAAHPPVPYTGQGAQMGLEDAGTIAVLLQERCLTDDGQLDVSNFSRAMKLYERIRIPRALEINQLSKSWGECQMKRSNREFYNQVKEEKIKRDVFFHETLPILIPGSTYNYKEAIEEFLQKEPKHLPAVQE